MISQLAHLYLGAVVTLLPVTADGFKETGATNLLSEGDVNQAESGQVSSYKHHSQWIFKKDSVSVRESVSFVRRKEKWKTDRQTDRVKQDKLSDIPWVVLKSNRNLDTWLLCCCCCCFSRRVPRKRRKRSKHVKAATRASISPNANTTASPVERWAQTGEECRKISEQVENVSQPD